MTDLAGTGRGPRRGRGLVRLLGPSLLVAVAFALVAGCGRQTAVSPTAGSGDAAVTRPGVGFRSAERLDEHYRKHGREFGGVTRDEYLRGAQALRDARVGGAIEQAVRDDGVVTRFDRASGAFVAFDAGGTIRTYFKPNDGEAYFRRQARR